MKNRIKITVPTIRSRAEAESVLGDIRTMTIERNQLVLEAEAAKKAIDAQIEQAVGERNQAMEIKTEQLRAWAEASPSEFLGKKTLFLTHGALGWRIGKPCLKTLPGWTWDRVLDALKEAQAAYVHVKESVNKEQLIADREVLGSETLREFGVRVIQEEPFFVEPKIEEVENRRTAEAV